MFDRPFMCVLFYVFCFVCFIIYCLNYSVDINTWTNLNSNGEKVIIIIILPDVSVVNTKETTCLFPGCTSGKFVQVFSFICSSTCFDCIKSKVKNVVYDFFHVCYGTSLLLHFDFFFSCLAFCVCFCVFLFLFLFLFFFLFLRVFCMFCFVCVFIFYFLNFKISYLLCVEKMQKILHFEQNPQSQSLYCHRNNIFRQNQSKSLIPRLKQLLLYHDSWP